MTRPAIAGQSTEVRTWVTLSSPEAGVVSRKSATGMAPALKEDTSRQGDRVTTHEGGANDTPNAMGREG